MRIGRLIFALLLGLIPAAVPSGEPALPAFDIFAGREQTLPFQGNWRLLAAHQRQLAAGTGAVRIELPGMEPGTSLAATLELDGRPQAAVTLWALRQLKLPETLPQLEPYRLLKYHVPAIAVTVRNTADQPERLPEGLNLIFPREADFPLQLTATWRYLAVAETQCPGTLSLQTATGRRLLETRGNGTYADLRDGRRRVIVFTPGFNFNDIVNILLIKKLLETKTWD